MKIDDNFYMKLAIDEAWKYQLLTYPNPAVGCVIVKNGKLLAIEAHKVAGMAHAEVNALKEAFLKENSKSVISNFKHRLIPIAPALGVGKVVVAHQAARAHAVQLCQGFHGLNCPVIQLGGLQQRRRTALHSQRASLDAGAVLAVGALQNNKGAGGSLRHLSLDGHTKAGG